MELQQPHGVEIIGLSVDYDEAVGWRGFIKVTLVADGSRRNVPIIEGYRYLNAGFTHGLRTLGVPLQGLNDPLVGVPSHWKEQGTDAWWEHVANCKSCGPRFLIPNELRPVA